MILFWYALISLFIIEMYHTANSRMVGWLILYIPEPLQVGDTFMIGGNTFNLRIPHDFFTGNSERALAAIFTIIAIQHEVQTDMGRR